MKLGAEQRHYFATYFAPGTPNGYYIFNPLTTEQNVYGFTSHQGNSIASLLVGWGNPYPWSGLDIEARTATKSQEQAFYVQDDWRVTQRLTLNLGLRYEWQTPFTERFDRIQIWDPDADTGIDLPGLGRLKGAARFAKPGDRTLAPDRNNLAPRLGFAYRITDKIVLRGGAGIYYGITTLQGDWQASQPFRKTVIWRASKDGGITRFATLANPFPEGGFTPQERKYGDLALWGFGPTTALLGGPARNPEIYQWNFGVQHQLTDTLLLEVAYSGSRSTHLGYDSTGSLNLLSQKVRDQYRTTLSDELPNPFLPLFQGPDAIFNEPDSELNEPTIPRYNLLLPYPQFPQGVSVTNAPRRSSSEYNMLLFRFEKRLSHGLNFLGHYTYSKFYSDSGANISWLGNSPYFQDIENLRAEWSVDGADTPHRFVFGWSYELPVGRGKALGKSMNRRLDFILGGWQTNGYLTFQQGNPIHILMYASRFSGGNQRPNLNGNPRSQFSVKEVVDFRGKYFNESAFSDPGDERAGNAPRYLDNLREPGIGNLDFSIFKYFNFTEKKMLEVRAEFFNFTNTPRFGIGSSFYNRYDDIRFGSDSFGTIGAQRNNARLVQMGIRFIF